jgi:hypothetical protein
MLAQFFEDVVDHLVVDDAKGREEFLRACRGDSERCGTRPAVPLV